MDWESFRSKTVLSADLSNLDRTMLVDGLLGSEADEDRLQAIVGVDRRRRVVDDGFDELIDFVCLSHHVALEEEEHRLLGDDAVLAAVDCIGIRIVGDGDAALCAEDFSALVIAIASGTAVVDDSRSAIVELQRDDGRIDVASLADFRIDGDRALCIYFLDFCAGEIADHIEIMNRHVEEDTAGNLYVIDGRRFRITGRDLDDLLLADFSGDDSIADSLEVVVKAAVEADLVFLTRLFDDVENFLDLIDIMVNRFLTEDVLAGAQCFDGERGMLVRGSADQDGFNLRIVEDLMVIFCRLLDAEGLCPSFRLLVHERISNRLDRCVLDELRDALTMYMADAACADNTNFNHCDNRLSLAY